MQTPMFFLWPQLLWLLWTLPFQVLAYVWLLRRRRQPALRYPSLASVRQALGPGHPWRRHLPPALFLLAMALALLAAARPQAALPLPTHQATVILAMDVSLSMHIDDVQPNRLVAAQQAAKAFVRKLPADVRVGIVSFAGTAQVVQRPTRDREDLLAAIDRLHLQPGTAIGSGIVQALAELFPQAGITAGDALVPTGTTRRPGGTGLQAAPAEAQRQAPPVPVDPGSDRSAAIVLLTDGRSTTGLDAQEAARMAAERGVRIHTVALGVVGGDTDEFADNWTLFLQPDEELLKAVAQATRGDYFQAGTGDSLLRTYEELGAHMRMETRATELSAPLTLGAVLLLGAAGLLSLLWLRRVA